ADILALIKICRLKKIDENPSITEISRCSNLSTYLSALARDASCSCVTSRASLDPLLVLTAKPLAMNSSIFLFKSISGMDSFVTTAPEEMVTPGGWRLALDLT
ncbi:MAG: hypothetical protein Q7J12_08390, partial [Syntrophales bacterium]|nr:hypothetical protein [Syntrophales bacterium]